MRPNTRWTRARYHLRRWSWKVLLTGWAVLEVAVAVGLSLVACLLIAVVCYVVCAALLGWAIWERLWRPQLPAPRQDCWFVPGRNVCQVATRLTHDPRFFARGRVSDRGGSTV